MVELKGKYNDCKIFTDNVDNTTISQITNLLNQEFVKDSRIRIMPDTHAGAGCVIGTTMTITDKVVPNLVGVDIGCGMLAVKLADSEISFEKLDEIIRKNIPSGFDVRSHEHPYMKQVDLGQLRCKNAVNMNRAKLSLGTLGGGNHFIEIDVDEENNKYLIIHTGSRNLGKQVAEFYQEKAWYCHAKENTEEKIKQIIQTFSAEGRRSEIESAIKEVKQSAVSIPKELAYVEGQLFEDYLHDMKITQNYAMLNRKAIADIIVREMNLQVVEEFQTIHNYIDIESRILRKGSVSAHTGEKLLIPINMRDGSLICIGKGNPDWNYSAPHGAGRLMSREKAQRNVRLEDFIESMNGIYTTSVGLGTIDESPFAYKPIEEIIANIEPTVEIVERIRPLYNFKASEQQKVSEPEKKAEKAEYDFER